MLLLGSKTFTVGGVTVFADHADPNQFWYLPAPVGLEKRDDGEPQFSLLKFRPAAVAAGVKGGGFVTFTAALPVDGGVENEIRSQISTFFPEVTEPRLAPVPFDEGTVQCVALDLQGPGGTAQPAGKQGAFVAVQNILGASVPSLMGNDDAVFSLTLTQEGATLLEQAFDDELQPIGVIYQLKFTGVRPALDVKITADLKRAYDGFSVGLDARIYCVEVGIDAAFEKLVQDGVIKVEVTNLAPNDADNKAAEQAALNLFKNDLLDKWFTPTLAAPKTPSSPASLDPPKTDPKTSPKPDPKADPAKPADPKTDPKADPGKPPDPAKDKGSVAKLADSAASVGDKAKDAAKSLTSGNPNSASGASPYGVALRMRYVHQDELKTVTLEYHRQDAVQRTYAPQGFFGAMLKSSDRAKHVRDVDLDDVFFRKLTVTATAPRDFDLIGLTSVHVGLSHGDPSDPAVHKAGDLTFEAKDKAPKVWEIFKDATDSPRFTCHIDWHFDPESGWDGEQSSYSFDPPETENADLYLNPFEFLTFAEVKVSPGRIDWNLIDYVEVDLDYAAPGGRHLRGHQEFRSDTKAQSWKLRLDRRAALAYTYQLTHHLKDGATVAEDPVPSSVPAVVVRDPFYARTVQIQPLLTAEKTKLAFVDVRCSDAGERYVFEESYQLAPGAAALRVKLPVLDQRQRTWKYRLALVGAGNQTTRGAWTDTDVDQLFITDTGAQ